MDLFTVPSNRSRREDRARRARNAYHKDIPDILRSCPRAKHAINKSHLIVDPPISPDPPPPSTSITTNITIDSLAARPDLKIRVTHHDTLFAARLMSERPFAVRRTAPSIKVRLEGSNVAILNMASASRPGGGFLDGANSQEEYLCARTTLYPALWDSFYRLPDVSAIWSPDVLVFRDPDGQDLAKRDRCFVDVISSSMLRFADARADGCTCGVSYCDKHRELVLRKMKAVMRIAQLKGVRQLVLGAWGAGAYGNPVREVAKLWRKVIAGAQRQRRPNAERWHGIQEIVFAVPDRAMIREFEQAFADVLAPEVSVAPPPDSGTDERMLATDAHVDHLILRIAETEMQMEQTASLRLRARHREVLSDLKRDLDAGIANRALRDSDRYAGESEDSDLDSFVIAGLPGSDGEDQSFYNFDDDDLSFSDDGYIGSETYEFRPRRGATSAAAAGGPPDASAPMFESATDDDSPDESLCPPLCRQKPAPRFDPDSGWFHGSVDELSRELMLGHRNKGSPQSGGTSSPGLVTAASGGEGGEVFPEKVMRGYEARMRGG